MKVALDIPLYDSEGVQRFWQDDSSLEISIYDKEILLLANGKALYSLALQMLYMAENDLPKGTHVHFDDFMCQGLKGDLELVIEKKD